MRPGSVSALPPGYSEWPAPAGLRHAIACLWAQVNPDGSDRTGLVLPDACSDLIWEQGRGAYVAGPDTGPVRTVMTGGTVIFGIRVERCRQPSRIALSQIRQVDPLVAELAQRDAERRAARGRQEADAEDDRATRHHGAYRAGVRARHVRAAALLPDQVAARIGQHQSLPVTAVRADLRPQARDGVPQPGRGWPLGVPRRQGAHRSGPQ